MIQLDLWKDANIKSAELVELKDSACKTENVLTVISNPQNTYQVLQIEKKLTHKFLLEIHYARRVPPISFAFGLFENQELVGVITYGMPASPSLCKGICGIEYKSQVLELNRLCLLNNKKGEASRLVGGSLKLLPKPKIIVSYADTDQEHTGVVYKSTLEALSLELKLQ
jgi:hypothetical protein